MPNEILQTFYQRMLPLYKPQAERLLEGVDPQLFSRVSFRYTFSVQAMIKISHIIEDTARHNPRVADFHASFQQLSKILPQKGRYRRLLPALKGLWLYGAADIPEAQLTFPRPVTIINTDGTLLTNYWFVILYGPGLGMTLLAEEVPSLTGEERYYEGFYTFDPDVAYQLLAILSQIYPEQVPEPRPPAELAD